MDIGKVGIWFFLDAMTAPDSAEFAKQVEKNGYKVLWIPEAVGREPFAHAAYLLSHTERLSIATGIANIWARDAHHDGALRRRLSPNFPAGASCSASASVTSLSSATCAATTYDKPYSYMKEYLPKMKGALYLAPAPKEPVPVVLAALHPKMLALSAAEANGTHTYFVPPEHTAKARAQIGPNAMLCAAQAVILETDAAKARKAAREYMKTYVPRLPNYTNNLKALGWADSEFENGCSRSAGRRDRGVGQRGQDSRSHRRASEGGRLSRLHPAAARRRRAAARHAHGAGVCAALSYRGCADFSPRCRLLVLAIAIAGCASHNEQQAEQAEAAAAKAQQAAEHAEQAAQQAQVAADKATEAADRATKAVQEATRKSIASPIISIR